MYGKLFFAGDHLQCIPSNLIISAYINAPFLLILSEKERVHTLFTHVFVVSVTVPGSFFHIYDTSVKRS